MSVYDVHGLPIETDRSLPAPRADRAAEYVVSWEPPAPVSEGPPPGELLAAVHEDGVAYSVSRDGATLWVRLHGAYEFRVAPGRIEAVPDPSSAPGLGEVLLCGNLPAVLLTARGETILHGSAVAFEEGALALVGGSGAGKSTLAAVLCSGGARLVTEDLLRVRFGGDVTVLPGIPEIRLRPQAAVLAERFADTRVTADGRVAVRPPEAGPSALRAILLPVPSPDAADVEAELLSGAAALVELGRHPRVLGWRTPEVRAERFHTLGLLARAVPVFRVRVPWGPPFHDGLIGALRDLAASTGAATP